MMNIKLALILPCFNEQEVLQHSYERLKHKFNELITKNIINEHSNIAFVDDGSRDSTWSIIESLTLKDKHIIGIKLSRNFGHQNALIAGFETLIDKYDCYITLDIDLQDDINTLEQIKDKNINPNFPY